MGAGGTAALQKCVDLVLALAPEHRAGGVEQPAAGLERRPQRVQQLGLDAAQRGDVLGAAQPADVGMAAHDARGAAGRVQQDGVERLAVPPVGRAAAVARARARRAGAGGRACRPRARGAAGRLSSASTSRSASSSRWAVLPPGAAQASSTRAPARQAGAHQQAARRAGRRRPAPRRRRRRSRAGGRRAPGASSTMVCGADRAGRQARGLPGAARYCAPVAWRWFTRRHIGGRSWAAARMRLPVRGPVGLQAIDPPLRMVPAARSAASSAAATSVSRSRRKRRSTALRKEADCGARLRAAVTAWSTSVWSG